MGLAEEASKGWLGGNRGRSVTSCRQAEAAGSWRGVCGRGGRDWGGGGGTLPMKSGTHSQHTTASIYYPPEVSSMKYCCLGVFRKESFRLLTKWCK